MNVTEQSMLSSYASGEILSARQKDYDNGRPKGDVFKNWWEILIRDVTDFLVKCFESQSV